MVNEPSILSIHGYYGKRNFGDDLMLLSLVESIIAGIGEFKIIIVSADSYLNKIFSYPNVEIVKRDIKSLLKTIKCSDKIIQGGGTYFHDSYIGMPRVFHYLKLSLWASIFAYSRLIGKTIAMLGVGIGPLYSFPYKLLSIISFAMTSDILVRDYNSYRILSKIKSGKNISIAYDLATMGYDLFHHSKKDLREKKYILGVAAISLEPFVTKNIAENFWSSLGEAIKKKLLENKQLFIRIFSFCRSNIKNNDDFINLEIYKQIAEKEMERIEIVFYDGNIYEFAMKIATCRWFIASRYHSVLSAFMSKCRIASVPYNNKVKVLCEQIGLGKEAIAPIDKVHSQKYWITILNRIMGNSKEFAATQDPMEFSRVTQQQVSNILKNKAATAFTD